MKKIMLPVIMVFALAACNDSGEKKARLKLHAAEQALSKSDFSEAKLRIDSIKILYPKAFEARRQGIKLLQQVDLKEQQRGLVYLDSMLVLKQKELDAIKDRYVFEKNAEYQKVGNYFSPSQTVEKNINRSYLRAQVNENGGMTLTSIYCGGSNIHHTAVKVTAPDGSFARTPLSRDSYETTDLGMKIEKADYKLGEDGDVIGFIHLNKDKKLNVEYIGDRNYKMRLPESDGKAISSLYELSRLLSSIEQIKKEIKEANLKIEFIKRKMSGN